MRKLLYILLLIFIAYSCGNSSTGKTDEEWISLFNGKDLTGWDIKIKGYELNNNYNNLFKVEDGVIKASYENFDKFNGEYGHLIYKEPFSHYRLRVEYRFVGEQAPGGESWAYKNSGVLLHSQSAASMELDQDYPVSIEAQLLGGDGTAERPTCNVCTPGTHVVINGQLVEQNCTNSLSKTYSGEEWVTAEFLVLGDSIIKHIVEGKVVMAYSKPVVGGTNKPADYPVPDGTAVKEGYICLQAESHPVEFRKVELLKLEK